MQDTTTTRKTLVAGPTLDLYRFQTVKYHGPYEIITSEYRVGKIAKGYLSSDRHSTKESALRQYRAMLEVFEK